MQSNDEIVIEEDDSKNKDYELKQTKEEQISGESEIKNQLKLLEGNAPDEKKENTDSQNINETENIEKNSTENNINNNNYLPSQSLSSERKEKETDNNKEKNVVSQKESTNITYINDNVSTIPTKEETAPQNPKQNTDNKVQSINNNEPKYNSMKSSIQNENIIEEKDEYRTLENILQPVNSSYDFQRNNNNIFGGNKLYFTEARIVGTKSDIHKSVSDKLYTISTIPEYPGTVKKNLKASETPIRSQILQKGKSTQKNRNNLNSLLNNLSPEQYMKKKVVNNYNFHPLQYRIKKIEEEIQKQNNYDFDRCMKELQIQYDKNKKNKEKEKQILEEHKRLQEKLKNMEEYRANLISQKIEKILQRQKAKNSNKKNLNKSQENNSAYNIQNSNNMIDNSYSTNNRNMNTIDAYSGTEKTRKLPIISTKARYEIIKTMKDKKENEFCFSTEKRLRDSAKLHKENYLRQLNIMNRKILKQSKIYNQRSLKCLNATKSNDAELEEDYIEKDMIRRYNIKQNLLREQSAKKEKIKENIFKNLENVREKKEQLEENEKKKIKEYIKRLNRKMEKQSPNNDYQLHQRNYFSKLQKKNLDKANKETNDYYNELILRQEDFAVIVNELQRDEPFIKQAILQRTIKEQNKKNRHLQSLNKFLEKMEKENINNQKEDTKIRLFKEKRRIELERKRKEEEEEEYNKK